MLALEIALKFFFRRSKIHPYFAYESENSFWAAVGNSSEMGLRKRNSSTGSISTSKLLKYVKYDRIKFKIGWLGGKVEEKMERKKQPHI